MQQFSMTTEWQTITTAGDCLLSFHGGACQVWIGADAPGNYGHDFRAGDKWIVPAGVTVKARGLGSAQASIIHSSLV